jgi:hypothetical protein
MFNPFVPLSGPLLQAFVMAGRKYFIRQTYAMPKDLPREGLKGWFIFSHYTDVAQAQHHFGAIEHDPYRLLYDWNKPGDQQKLWIAAGKPEGYIIYSSLFEKDWQKHLNAPLKAKVKKYIDYSLGWKPGRGETVNFEIFASYGELYAKLKLRRQEVRVKLVLIENL